MAEQAPNQPPTPKRAPQWGDANWYGEQNAEGVGLSLIRENLRLTPIERLRRMERHSREVRILMEHGRRSSRRDSNGSQRCCVVTGLTLP